MPANKVLKQKIETKIVRTSLAFLLSRRAVFSSFNTLEDFFLYPSDPPPADFVGLQKHLGIVCEKFQNVLYRHEVFIGASVLDDIVFGMIRSSGVTDPIMSSLILIRSVGISKPGLLLYPLHSFGLLGVGLLEKLTSSRFELFAEDADLYVRGQTNSLPETIRFIERAAFALGINRTVPADMIEHYSRSRPTKWLTHNHLLLLKARTFSNSYYENQRFLMLHLERACSLIFMLSALENGFVKREQHLFSTSRVNNWATQDIYHFVVLEPKPHSLRHFLSKCIPMNYRATELAELSNVNVEVNLISWARRRPIMSRICRVLADVERGYLHSNMLSDGFSPKGRALQKIMTALRYFRRSFRYTSAEDDIVNMTIALEVLLTDSYAPQIGARLRERAALLLNGHPRKKACVEAVEAIYDARNQAVHTGTRTIPVDLPTVREAFVLCLLEIVTRLPKLPRGTPDPMTQLSLRG